MKILGLIWLNKWGPARYAMNGAFLLLKVSELSKLTESDRAAFAKEAINQANYLLGDSGRSFVVGFGNNPPLRPHHRGASCPAVPEECNWDNFNSPDASPFTLFGALVGGPGANDEYTDDRKDYIKNEVATDYNAGFQAAIAAMKCRVVTDCLSDKVDIPVDDKNDKDDNDNAKAGG